MSEFTDIKIIGVDDSRTHVPDSSRPAMYDVYFNLSDHPPQAWGELFDHEWQNRFYSMKRRGHVTGAHIVIHCCLDEIETHHLPQLMETLARVNEGYRQYANQQARLLQQAAERKAVADQQKKDTLGRLKFN